MLSENILPIKTSKGYFFLDVNDLISISIPEIEIISGAKCVCFTVELKTQMSTNSANAATNKKKITYTTTQYGNCSVEDLKKEVVKIYDDLTTKILGNKVPLGTIPTLDLAK